MRRLGPLLVTLATLLTVVGAGSAVPTVHAASSSGLDPAGDAPAHLDLLRMKASNGPHRVIVRLSLAEFEYPRTSAYAVISSPTGRRPYYVAGWTNSEGVRAGRFFFRFDEDGMTRVRCRGDRIRTSRERARVTILIPQRCLRATPDRLSIAALTETRSGGDADDISPVRLGRG